MPDKISIFLDAVNQRAPVPVPASPKARRDVPTPTLLKSKETAPKKRKKSVHLRVDADVLDFFKARGKGHLTRMNDVLRSHMETLK